MSELELADAQLMSENTVLREKPTRLATGSVRSEAFHVRGKEKTPRKSECFLLNLQIYFSLCDSRHLEYTVFFKCRKQSSSTYSLR